MVMEAVQEERSGNLLPFFDCHVTKTRMTSRRRHHLTISTNFVRLIIWAPLSLKRQKMSQPNCVREKVMTQTPIVSKDISLLLLISQ
jgi:hypothetical protein